MTPLDCSQVQRLLSDLLADDIEPVAGDNVHAHLSQCASCRQIAEGFIWQDRLLSELAAQQRSDVWRTRVHKALTGLDSLAAPRASAASSRSAGPHVRIFSRYRRSMISLAAVAVAVVVALSLWHMHRPAEPGREMHVAELVQVEGMVLLQEGRDESPARQGTPLRAGQRVIIRGPGRAVAVYPDATRLELQGDSSLDWLSAEPGDSGGQKRLHLAAGTLLARVPPPAKGFRIDTPTASVVDLGTQFGLVVAESGQTDVHVLQGRVEVGCGESVRERVAAGHAVRVEAVGGRIVPIAFQPQRFVESLEGGPRRAVAPAAPAPSRVLVVIAHEDFNYADYDAVRRELERAGARVVVASTVVTPVQPAPAAGAKPVKPDILQDDVKAADFDAVIFTVAVHGVRDTRTEAGSRSPVIVEGENGKRFGGGP